MAMSLSGASCGLTGNGAGNYASSGLDILCLTSCWCRVEWRCTQAPHRTQEGPTHMERPMRIVILEVNEYATVEYDVIFDADLVLQKRPDGSLMIIKDRYFSQGRDATVINSRREPVQL